MAQNPRTRIDTEEVTTGLARRRDGGVPALAARIDTEEVITGHAAAQHGVVAREQLLRAGVSGKALDRRLKAKRLRLLHRGVYRVGPLLAPRAKEMAAVLACGPGAAVSHHSAAALWALPVDRSGTEPVDVATPGDRRRPGIRIHRVRALAAGDVTELEGIPVTTPARTLLDLAGTLSRRELERALAEALARRLVSQAELVRLLARIPRRRGSRRLRALLAAGPAFTRSEAEERLLALIRKAQLPAPEVNARVAGHEVDFFWRAARLITEVDGFAFHSSAGRFESDRRRDAVLAAAGMRVGRVTWRQLVSEPEAVVARLAQALARASP